MKRTLILVAVVVGFAAVANAATLTVTSVKNTYTVGETITLNVTGDSQGASSNGIFGRLLYEAGLTETVTSSQTLHTFQFGGMSSWTTSSLETGDGFAEVFDQTPGITASTVGNLQAATATLVAQNAGVVSVDFQEDGSGFGLNFFGLTTSTLSPEYTFTINPIPEPTTAALIGLGLIGLAMGGRRR